MILVFASGFVQRVIAALEDTRLGRQQTVRFMFNVTIVVVNRSAVSALEFHGLVLINIPLDHFSNLKWLSTGLNRTYPILGLIRGDTRFAKVLFAVFVVIHDRLH